MRHDGTGYPTFHRSIRVAYVLFNGAALYHVSLTDDQGNVVSILDRCVTLSQACRSGLHYASVTGLGLFVPSSTSISGVRS
jgi:hypothetical protein